MRPFQNATYRPNWPARRQDTTVGVIVRCLDGLDGLIFKMCGAALHCDTTQIKMPISNCPKFHNLTFLQNKNNHGGPSPSPSRQQQQQRPPNSTNESPKIHQNDHPGNPSHVHNILG